MLVSFTSFFICCLIMSVWSNSDILFFMECYRDEPCLWNSKHCDNKHKHKVADAWIRLSVLLKKPVKELKSKKEILMVSFRKHIKRKIESIHSGPAIGRNRCCSDCPHYAAI